MTDLNAILLEGIAYTSEEPYPDAHGATAEGFNNLLIQSDDGQIRSVYETLKPFIDGQTQIAIHHLPDNPPNITLWGGGSCMWQGAGRCPFGHHENPHRLFNVSGGGFLVYDLDHSKRSGGWWLEKTDGGRMMLPLGAVLPGHRCRVAAATLMTVEQMRDAVVGSGLDSVEGMGQRVEDLREMIKGLSKAVKGD